MSKRSEARRTVARRLHPDLGGDPQEYLAAMVTIDEHFELPSSAAGDQEIHIVRRRRRLASLTRMTGKAVGTVRTRIPRGWPGAQRYGRP